MKKNKIKKIWNQLGPGLVTGSSDDDPSGITTYSQAGAKFGFDTLWTALLTWPLMTAIQHMCAKIGLATKQGITGVIKKHYPPFFLRLILLICIPAILLNIGANISAMSGVIRMMNTDINPFFSGIAISILSLWFMVQFSYRKLSTVLKFVSLILLVYIIIPFLIQTDWKQIIIATMFPKITWNKEYAGMLVAILGTTLSPYLFFWQSNMDAEELSSLKSKKNGLRKLFFNEKTDITIGMGFSNLVMYFIMLTTGSVLHEFGKTNIVKLEDAAMALRPLAGENAFLLFSIGILGTGFLSIPVLTGTISYMICETMDWETGMNKKYHEAKAFYNLIGFSLLGGVAFQILEINPIKSLTYSALGYGLVAPIVMVMVIFISNNKKLMGKHSNGIFINILGWISVILMLVSILFFLMSSV